MVCVRVGVREKESERNIFITHIVFSTEEVFLEMYKMVKTFPLQVNTVTPIAMLVVVLIIVEPCMSF